MFDNDNKLKEPSGNKNYDQFANELRFMHRKNQTRKKRKQNLMNTRDIEVIPLFKEENRLKL